MLNPLAHVKSFIYHHEIHKIARLLLSQIKQTEHKEVRFLNDLVTVFIHFQFILHKNLMG